MGEVKRQLRCLLPEQMGKDGKGKPASFSAFVWLPQGSPGMLSIHQALGSGHVGEGTVFIGFRFVLRLVRLIP